MKKNILLLTFVIMGLVQVLFQQPCFAQNATIDSLLKVLESAKDDTGKVKILNELSWEMSTQGKTKEAIHYATNAKLLSEKINYTVGIAQSYSRLGNAYLDISSFPEALENFTLALDMNERSGNKKAYASCLNNIGIIYYEQSNYNQSLKYHLKALKIREEIDDKKGLAASYINVGINHMETGNYPEALNNYFIALKIREQISDKKEWPTLITI